MARPARASDRLGVRRSGLRKPPKLAEAAKNDSAASLGVMVVPDPRAGGGHHRPRAGPGAVVTICSELVDITVL